MDEYSGAIQREVRFSLMDDRLRRVVSESDVCQSVMTNLFVGLWAGRYEFDSPQQLTALLKDMARKKVADVARYWRSQRRDMRRNVSMDAAPAQYTNSTESTPSQIVANQELLTEVRRRLSKQNQQILLWRQDRMGWAEVAERLKGGSSPEAIRKQYERALAQVTQELSIV